MYVLALGKPHVHVHVAIVHDSVQMSLSITKMYMHDNTALCGVGYITVNRISVCILEALRLIPLPVWIRWLLAWYVCLRISTIALVPVE